MIQQPPPSADETFAVLQHSLMQHRLQLAAAQANVSGLKALIEAEEAELNALIREHKVTIGLARPDEQREEDKVLRPDRRTPDEKREGYRLLERSHDAGDENPF